jgi:hypothetical protein
VVSARSHWERYVKDVKSKSNYAGTEKEKDKGDGRRGREKVLEE